MLTACGGIEAGGGLDARPRIAAGGASHALDPAGGTSARREPPHDPSLARALSFDAPVSIGLRRDDTIFTTSARTVDFNGTALVPRVSWRRAASLFDGSDEVGDPLDRELTVERIDLRGVFGLREDLTVGIGVPYLRKRLEFDDPAGGRSEFSSEGLGDVSVVAKWRFFQRTELGGTTEAALLAGTELPTGSTDERDGGTRLPRPLQPGSGAFDPIAGLAFTRLWDGGRWLVNADALVKWNRESGGFDPGDQVRFDVGLQWRAYPARYERYDQPTLNLVLELQHLRRGHDRTPEGRITASGGWETFLSPGVQWIVNDRLLLEAGVQVPVLRDLNGPQLGTDVAVTLGLRWRF